MYPAKRLHLLHIQYVVIHHITNCLHYLEILVLREEVRKVDSLMSTPLRNYDYTSNFLHLRIVWRTHSIQIPRDLE